MQFQFYSQDNSTQYIIYFDDEGLTLDYNGNMAEYVPVTPLSIQSNDDNWRSWKRVFPQDLIKFIEIHLSSWVKVLAFE